MILPGAPGALDSNLFTEGIVQSFAARIRMEVLGLTVRCPKKR